MNINQIISGAITDQLTKSMSQKLGVPPNKVKGVVDLALPVLIGGLAKESQNPTDLNTLSKALSKDHNGAILNQIPSAVNDTSTQQEGAKILSHILGNKQAEASQAISNHVSLNPEVVQQILSIVAPVLMGAVGKQHKNNNFSLQRLSDLLQTMARSSTSESSRDTGLLSQILDQNHDGSIIDDGVRVGVSVLENLLSKK